MVMAQGGGGGGSDKRKPDALAALMAKIGASTGTSLGATPDVGGGATDYYGQAMGVYDPRFDYLDSMEDRSRGRASEGDAQLKALYAALARQIAGQAGDIKSNYGQGLKSTDAAYDGAYGNIKATYDQSRNGVADTLARLGIQEAGANTVGKQSQQQQLMQNILSANGLASHNALEQGRQSALTFNTQQKNNAGLVGAEARTGLKQQLMDFLGQLDMKRADLNTQVNQTAQGYEQQAAQQASEQEQFDYQRAKDAAELKYKYDALGAKSPSGGTSTKGDPLGSVNQIALDAYQGNQQAAGNAVKAVTDAISALGTDDFSFAELMDTVKRRLLQANGQFGDQGQVNRIAAAIYEQMYG